MPDQKNQGKEKYQPYVPAGESIAEVTIRAVVLGSILSVVFGVANAYIGLKYGMTVSASIPAAVISMAVLRTLFRRKRATVLENNIVQTVGSAGESLAAGIIFTIPAFFIWAANDQLIAAGYHHEISKMQIFWLSMLGGGLGILLMIPLRKYLVEKEHGRLAFPEGTACAEIIVAGDEGGKKAKTVFLGIGIGAVYKFVFYTLRMWAESPSYNFKKFLKGGTIGIDATPVLLGVGYIIGPRIAALMMSGAVLGYLGVSPLLSFIGDQIPGIIISPGEMPLSDMDPAQLRDAYIKYLGVGAVAVGGFVSLAKSIPVIFHSFAAGAKELISRKEKGNGKPRTDRDLPMSFVLIGSLLIVLAIWAYPGTELHFIGAMTAVIFGFFFVVVAARIVGIVGSSSSPVSGMTIATLLVTCMILLSFGVSGVKGMVTAMSVGTVVCIAVCMSGDIAQDLKTGYLLGATPSKMQLTEFIGLLFPAIAMGFTLYLLGDAFGFVRTEATPNPLLAPQANVMATVVQGMMNANIPWQPILIGGMIAVAIELLGIQSLPFAIGLYLPLSLSTPIMAGGILAMLIKKSSRNKILSKSRHQMGILFGSGLVAGDALVAVISAFLISGWGSYRIFFDEHEGMLGSLTGSFGPWLALIAFASLAILFYSLARSFGSTDDKSKL
ncbi:MAG TPA: oligopeptide transporter, OPT family [candidate division Zixibacteria bacterium]|nr:oligopeptide transporter, OPT family [candidate division Zixibacteria bacterium]